MKKLKEFILTENNFFKNLGIGKVRIEEWLNKYKIKNYTINDDLTIDVKGDVDLKYYPENEFPDYIQFRNVSGTFSLYTSKISSLKGCPIKVDGGFDCERCKNLTSLKGAPNECKSFDCSNCRNLTSLEGALNECEYFDCSDCDKLTSLKGSPKKVLGNFVCNYCNSLKSLKGLPDVIEGNLK